MRKTILTCDLCGEETEVFYGTCVVTVVSAQDSTRLELVIDMCRGCFNRHTPPEEAALKTMLVELFKGPLPARAPSSSELERQHQEEARTAVDYEDAKARHKNNPDSFAF